MTTRVLMQNLDDALKELEEMKAQNKLQSPAQLECASDPWPAIVYAVQAVITNCIEWTL